MPLAAPKSLSRQFSQERIVFAIAAGLFAAFSVFLDGFATAANLFSLVQAVAVIGSLGVAMSIVILGRGIDLSLVATMTMPVAWFTVQVQGGGDVATAALLSIGMAAAIGLLNGWLVAYAEVPGIFATIGTGAIVYGAVQFFLVPTDVIPLPAQLAWLNRLAMGRLFGIVPNTIVFSALLCLLAALLLRMTAFGRFIYAVGDNPQSAKTVGINVRPLVLLQYVLASVIAVLVGFMLVGTVNSANTRLFNSTLIYDVILVVVLGGVGLSGARGGIKNVIVGTLLVGILINGMTIMNLSYVAQNLLKATVLLLAIILDTLLNPRDEQVSQQGDI